MSLLAGWTRYEGSWRWPSSKEKADVELHAVVTMADDAADATATVHLHSASTMLVVSLVAPALNNHDLAALRLVSRQMCEAAGLVVTTLRCMPTTPLRLKRNVLLAYPNANTLVLDLSALEQTHLALNQQPVDGLVVLLLRLMGMAVYWIVGLATCWGLLTLEEGIAKRMKMPMLPHEPGRVFAAAFDTFRRRRHYGAQLRRLRLWQHRHLLPSLGPLLQRAKHFSAVCDADAGDVLPASVLHRLLERGSSLETFSYHRRGAELLTFSGQGATAAERHASLLPQLAAMHPSAPLLHPASWATHNRLLSASLHLPTPSSSLSMVPSAALATASLQSLHLHLAAGTKWRYAALASQLAALPLSLTHFSLCCNIAHLASSGGRVQAPTVAPNLPNLRHLQLEVRCCAEEHARAWHAALRRHTCSPLLHLASAWTHLTQLTQLSIDGLPWLPFQHLPNIRHLAAANVASSDSAAAAALRPAEAIRLPWLQHLAGHLRHLALGQRVVEAAALHQLAALTYLELKDVDLTPGLCRAFTHLPRLDTLRLDPALDSKAAHLPTDVQRLEHPDSAPFPPSFSTLQLSPPSAAAALNSLAVWTQLPARATRVCISIIATDADWTRGRDEACVPMSLGPLHEWSPCWRGSVLPPAWYRAPCLQAVDLGSFVPASLLLGVDGPAADPIRCSDGNGGGNTGAAGGIGGIDLDRSTSTSRASGNWCGSASASASASASSSASASASTCRGSSSSHSVELKGLQSQKHCCEAVYVWCTVRSTWAPASSQPEGPLHLDVTGGLAFVKATPQAFRNPLLLVAGDQQEAPLLPPCVDDPTTYSSGLLAASLQ